MLLVASGSLASSGVAGRSVKPEIRRVDIPGPVPGLAELPIADDVYAGVRLVAMHHLGNASPASRPRTRRLVVRTPRFDLLQERQQLGWPHQSYRRAWSEFDIDWLPSFLLDCPRAFEPLRIYFPCGGREPLVVSRCPRRGGQASIVLVWTPQVDDPAILAWPDPALLLATLFLNAAFWYGERPGVSVSRTPAY